MNLDLLFQQYYFQYRTVAQTPPNTDDEYIIFTGLANEAINRWANYENTLWKELFDTAQIDKTGALVVKQNTLQYAAPTNMRMAGGFVRIFDSNGATIRRIPIVQPQDVQFQGDTTSYCWFEGDPNNGFVLNLNPDPDNVIIGKSMDYTYYKTPNLLAAPDDVPQMSQPYFIVHRALAMRFRGSRNPYYLDAKRDGEDVLSTMQAENNSGDWSNPWSLADHSGAVFGTAPGESLWL